MFCNNNCLCNQALFLKGTMSYTAGVDFTGPIGLRCMGPILVTVSRAIGYISLTFQTYNQIKFPLTNKDLVVTDLTMQPRLLTLY